MLTELSPFQRWQLERFGDILPERPPLGWPGEENEPGPPSTQELNYILSLPIISP